MSKPARDLVRPLIIIASERTGSNYLCDLLSHHPQIAAYYEIFANVFVMMTDAEVRTLCKMQNWPFASRDDQELIKRFKERPHQIIELIANRLPVEKKVLSFKVFQNHLPHEALAQMLQDYEAVAVTRRVIDSYISFVKAREKDEWVRSDTTKVQATLHIEGFVSWYQERHDYYKLCANQYLETHGREISVLSYEEFTCGSNLENLIFACEKIADSTDVYLDTYLDSTDIEFELKFWKQDKNPSVTRKVKNWREFKTRLKERGLLEIAFDSFLGPIESLYSSPE